MERSQMDQPLYYFPSDTVDPWLTYTLDVSLGEFQMPYYG